VSSPAFHKPFAAFLDRDGTLIRDSGYLADPEGVVLLPGAAEGVALLNGAGVPVIVVTNQSGIGRGRYSVDDFLRVQQEVERQLLQRGAVIEAVYHCPHDPEKEECECRKPRLGLFRRAARERGVELRGSLFVGDRLRDVLPAAALGGIGVLVASDEVAYDEAIPPWCLMARDLPTGIRRALRLAGIEGHLDGERGIC
jgi:D-glycero-D-manno-heptose 1,7-bisphosphate phosphatase